MGKIGIATIHSTFSHGAVLQAFATQKFFELHGYDVELIDYVNPLIDEQLRLTYKQGGKLRGYLITFLRNTLFHRLRYARAMIASSRKVSVFSSRRYSGCNELRDAPYEILVAGSDQVWNSDLCRGLDPVFFLQFGHPKKRISVASSIGSVRLSSEEMETAKAYLSTFSSISVREPFAKEQLQPLVDNPIKVLLDPTLLLSKNDWKMQLQDKTSVVSEGQGYILAYFVGEHKSRYRKTVAAYANMLGLPVWTIQSSNYTWPESSRKLLGVGIADFVALIDNAKLVITDSFHGTAFSLNMETDFVSLTNRANPVRVMALLDSLRLSDRLDMQVDTYYPADFDAVRPVLEEMRADSTSWILKAVGSENADA